MNNQPQQLKIQRFNYITLLYAESISAWSNQGLVMCLVSILNQYKLHGGNIYLSIYLIIQLEINPYIGIITVNGIFTSIETIVIIITNNISWFSNKIKSTFSSILALKGNWKWAVGTLIWTKEKCMRYYWYNFET